MFRPPKFMVLLMGDDPLNPAPVTIDIATVMGSEPPSVHVFAVYVPNKDRDGIEIGTQRKWVLEAVTLLGEINGGSTALNVEGSWLNPETNRPVFDHPVYVFSFIKDGDEFRDRLPKIRLFLHRMGRETNQGEVAFEFDHDFYRITKFDT